MSIVTALASAIREDKGTIACRKLKKADKSLTPAILYGDKQPNVMLSITQKELDLLHSKHRLVGHLFELSINKKKQIALAKAIQTHFLLGNVTHVDFQRVDKKHKITTRIPILFSNVELSPATKQKGQVTYTATEIEITCLPQNLPEHIVLDLTNLEIDQIVHRSELILPKGVKLAELTDEQHNPAIVTAHMPKTTSAAVSSESQTTDGSTEEIQPTPE